MKIAIIGAGVSGLSCAHELEVLGTKFDIFEKKYRPGEAFSFTTCGLNMIYRPIKDIVRFVDKTLNIRITPINELKRIKIFSKSNTADIRGKLGYVFLRGHDENSLESQLYNIVKTEVKFDTSIDVKKIQKEYDKIIVATGNQAISREFGVWNEYSPTFGAKLNIAVGKFEPNTAMLWYNTDYAKTGYVYLIPFNESSANIGLIVPNTNKDELEYLWNNFVLEEKLNYEITETYDIEFHVGYAEPLCVNNMYFIGNAGGFVEPFKGCGQLMGMWSGVLAARSIVNNFNYSDEAKKLLPNVKNNIKIRKALDKMSNDDFDKLVAFLGLPIIKNITYNTHLDITKYISYFLKK